MAIQRIRLAWEELNDSSYQGGKDLIKQIGKQAKGVACALYRNTPGALVPNPAASFLRGMWDGICSDDPDGLPPAPQPPFDGGQCCNKRYRVTVGFISNNLSLGGVGYKEKTFNVNNNAKITSVNNPTANRQEYLVLGERCDGRQITQKIGSGGVLYWGEHLDPVNTNQEHGYGMSIVSVATQDGSDDNCGSLPPVYPPYDPDTFPPPSGDFIIEPRPGSPEFNFTIPFIWINANFNLNIRPTIDLGGIKIIFDLGGITIEYNPDTAPLPLPDYNPHPDFTLPPPPSTDFPDIPDFPDYSPDFGDIKDDLTDIKDKLDEEEPPPEPDLIDIEVPIGNCDFQTFDYTETTQTIQVDARQASVVYGQYRAAADRVREECKPSDEPGESVSAIPEWWQTVLTGEVPQLVQVSRREGTRTYYQLAIPHPLDTSPRDTPLIPIYRAGDYMGMITLRDNSKFICYCFDEAEANRVLDAATAIIDGSWQFSPQRRRIAKTNGYGIAQDLRKPTKNVYFAQGNRLLRPTWSRKVRNASDIV